MGSFLSFALGQVQEQVQQFSRQRGNTEQVNGNIRRGMQPIQGGAWVGQGSRAFIQEILTKLIPHTMELIAAIAGFGSGITRAVNIIQNADRQVSGIVRQVSSVFSAVF